MMAKRSEDSLSPKDVLVCIAIFVVCPLLLIGLAVWLLGWITQGPWVWLFVLAWGVMSLREWFRRRCPLHKANFEYEFLPDSRTRSVQSPLSGTLEHATNFPYAGDVFRSFANPNGKYELRYCPICRKADAEARQTLEKRTVECLRAEWDRQYLPAALAELEAMEQRLKQTDRD